MELWKSHWIWKSSHFILLGHLLKMINWDNFVKSTKKKKKRIGRGPFSYVVLSRFKYRLIGFQCLLTSRHIFLLKKKKIEFHFRKIKPVSIPLTRLSFSSLPSHPQILQRRHFTSASHPLLLPLPPLRYSYHPLQDS